MLMGCLLRKASVGVWVGHTKNMLAHQLHDVTLFSGHGCALETSQITIFGN